MYGASADLTLTEAGHLLFMQWIHELSSDELKTTQYAPHGDILPQIEIQPEWRFTGPDGGGFGLSYDPDQSLWVVNCYSNTEQSAVLRIVERAARETQFGNISGKICYHTELTTSKLDFTVELGVQMLRALGDHVVIEGMSRLSDVVWLEFALLDPPPGASPLIPRTKIAVDIWAPGIKHGPLSARVANSVLETTRLICVLALGLPLDIPTAIFPAKGADLEQARERISNDSILTLARNTEPFSSP